VKVKISHKIADKIFSDDNEGKFQFLKNFINSSYKEKPHLCGEDV
jgi:hypothetical protein